MHGHQAMTVHNKLTTAAKTTTTNDHCTTCGSDQQTLLLLNAISTLAKKLPIDTGGQVYAATESAKSSIVQQLYQR